MNNDKVPDNNCLNHALLKSPTESDMRFFFRHRLQMHQLKLYIIFFYNQLIKSIYLKEK